VHSLEFALRSQFLQTFRSFLKQGLETGDSTRGYLEVL